MGKGMRVGLVAIALLAVAGVAGAGMLRSSGSDPGTVVAGGVIADPANDSTADEGNPDTLLGRVDITGVSAEYRPDGRLAMTAMTREVSDPFLDPNWTADGTFLSWEVDTTGDGVLDYEVSYYWRGGELTGEVISDKKDAVVCPISGGEYSPQKGYTVLVDPACLDNPKSIAYQVIYYYQTDYLNDDAPVITDLAPDEGMTPRLIAPEPAAN